MKRFYLVSIVLAIQMVLVCAFRANAQSNVSVTCRSCPQGTTDVALLIAEADSGRIPHWLVLANFSPPADLMVLPPVWVSSSTMGVSSTLRSFSQSCYRIKYLKISSHGSPGNVDMAYSSDIVDSENLNVRSLNDYFFPSGLSCIMAPQATIQFDGCNLGRGCRGEDFMMAIAAHLLEQGGQVVAPTFYSSAVTEILEESLNLNRQVLFVNRGLQNSHWLHAPQSVAACRDRIGYSLQQALRLQQTFSQCSVLSTRQRRRLSGIIDNLRQADSRQLRLGATRTGFDSLHWEAAWSFYSAFYSLDSDLEAFHRVVPACQSVTNSYQDPWGIDHSGAPPVDVTDASAQGAL